MGGTGGGSADCPSGRGIQGVSWGLHRGPRGGNGVRQWGLGGRGGGHVRAGGGQLRDTERRGGWQAEGGEVQGGGARAGAGEGRQEVGAQRPQRGGDGDAGPAGRRAGAGRGEGEASRAHLFARSVCLGRTAWGFAEREQAANPGP